MTTVTISTNDMLGRIVTTHTESKSECIDIMRSVYPITTLDASNVTVLRDADGYRCIIQEG